MARSPFRFAEGTAVVTGAAGGMGEHVAKLLGERGSDLVLVDCDGDRLDTVAAAIRAKHPGLSVTTETVDWPTARPSTRWRPGSSPVTRRSGFWSTTPASRSAGTSPG